MSIQKCATYLNLYFYSFLVTVTIFFNNGGVEESNILFFHLAASASHRTSIWPLTEKLADKGHNVTYIFPVHNKVFTHPAIEEITPSKMMTILDEKLLEYDINFRLNGSTLSFTRSVFISMCFDLCNAFYDSPEIQEWLERPGLHYDLVMIDASLGECIYGIVHKFQAKHIVFMPVIIGPFHLDIYGVLPETSSVPSSAGFLFDPPKPTEMTFLARLASTMETFIWQVGYLAYTSRIERLISEKMNITDFPPLVEFERNTSLVLVNAHFIEEYPLSLPPMFQSYSGLWCSKKKIVQRKPLPKIIAKFVEGNDTDGFIYLSFGSAVSVASMPIYLRKIFFETFTSFPKLRFLMRWTASVPDDKPDNLLLQKWFPQHDILAHPKIKGFVTQCGRPSTQEALCHGVPLITIPFIGDQDYNADRMEHVGAAIKLDISNITFQNLHDAVKDLAYADKYSKRMGELSIMFKDRPLDPLDNALYWTEYALRHDTSLLKPLGINQARYQRRLLDVYLVLLGISLIFLAVVVALVSFTVKYIKHAMSGKDGTRENGKLKLKQN